jgi:hypothetical protein
VFESRRARHFSALRFRRATDLLPKRAHANQENIDISTQGACGASKRTKM